LKVEHFLTFAPIFEKPIVNEGSEVSFKRVFNRHFLKREVLLFFTKEWSNNNFTIYEGKFQANTSLKILADALRRLRFLPRLDLKLLLQNR
jgi:hypothetical protein